MDNKQLNDDHQHVEQEQHVTSATEQLRHLTISKPNVGRNSYPNFDPTVTMYDTEGSFEPLYDRKVFEDGQLVVKPAKKYLIFLKNGAPNGCDNKSYHLRFLGKVSSNSTEAFEGSSNRYDTVFVATLTDDEYANMIGTNEVEKTVRMRGGGTVF